MAIGAACVTLGAAINHVREWVRVARKPHHDLRSEVSDIRNDVSDIRSWAEGEHAEFEQRFKRDLVRHEKNAEESKILLRGMLTLITSNIEGNHIEELKERRDEIQSYLINKQ